MAEQSSTITMFRALIMLVCVILIPLAAIGGISFPDVVKAIKSGRLPTLADFRTGNGSPQRNLSEAPRFAPPTPLSVAANTHGPNGAGSQKRESGICIDGPGRTPSLVEWVHDKSDKSQVIPVNYDVPAPPQPGQNPNRSTTFPQNAVSQNNDFRGEATRGIPPLPPGANQLLAPGHGSVCSQDEGGTQQETASQSQSPHREQLDANVLFKQVPERLRQLGATYYLLETCGDQSEQYRFYCRMSIGGNPHVTRNFWSIDADPLKAMTTVLRQIEDWQKGDGASLVGATGGPATNLR